ncbi:hypothetical protein MMC21_001837 [Puttea exsequens]|nr:hypothetical protein [Puttea exsequens]
MTAQNFNDVPYDIKKAVLSFITRPEDLKNLCLTCKWVREIATPQLYKKVLLFVGGHKDVRISGLLSRSNPGVQHIRKIYLQLEKTVIPPPEREETSDSEEEDEPQFEEISGTARQAQFTVRLLLDFLPNDILENFSWQNWEPFQLTNWELLLKKQRRLKAIEIARIDRPFMPVLEKQPQLLQGLTNVSSLHFYPDNLDRLQACAKALEAHPKIEELQLSSDRCLEDEITEGLQDSSTRPGRITREIFQQFMPFDRCTDPMILKKLSIDNIDLRYAADTYMKFIKFNALESLVIGGCTGEDAVFAQLSKPHLRPTKLKKLRWFHEDDNENHALEAFEGLLEATAGLEVLHVETNNLGSLPKAGAIGHHGKTLQILGVRNRMPQGLVMYEPDQFEEICTSCLELRQLSVTFPNTSVSDAFPSSEFKAFLRSCKKLRHLITMNFQAWPSTSNSFVSNRGDKLKPQWYDLYEHDLQRLAQQIFEASDVHSKEQGWGLGHRSMLAVVAFGANGKTQFDEHGRIKLKQVPFVRGQKVDPFGDTSFLAVKTTWKMVQFVETESDILNHSLYDLHEIHNTP